MRRRTLGALPASAAVPSLCHMFTNTRKGEAKKKFPSDEPFCSFFYHLGLLTGRDPDTHLIDFVLLFLVISTEPSPRNEIPRLFSTPSCEHGSETRSTSLRTHKRLPLWVPALSGALLLELRLLPPNLSSSALLLRYDMLWHIVHVSCSRTTLCLILFMGSRFAGGDFGGIWPMFRSSHCLARTDNAPISDNQKNMKQQMHQLGSDGRTDLSTAGSLTGNDCTGFGPTGTYVGSNHADPLSKPAGGNQGVKKMSHVFPRHAHSCAIMRRSDARGLGTSSYESFAC